MLNFLKISTLRLFIVRNLDIVPYLAVLIVAMVSTVLFSESGCAAKTIHPGAVSQFDSQTYDALITIQAALLTARQQAPNYPQFKKELNQAIAAYNTAQEAYKLYHAAALSGDTSQQAAVQAQIAALTGQVAKLLTSMGVK